MLAAADGKRSSWLRRLFLQEDINFLLTNRIPRRLATRIMGWFSHLEIGWLARLSIAVWRRFAPDLDLSEAKDTRFPSLHACFVRELRPGARPVDPDPGIVVSPCDAEIGECGRVVADQVIQAKGFPYTLSELLIDPDLARRYHDGLFVTLRLRSSMYHRFHAPCACRVRRVDYVAGDTWNVNPIALARVERLFCKNERAIVDLELPTPAEAITLVPVAAILVASIRLHCLAQPLDLRYRGANRLDCDAQYDRGQEMGYFEHGSTILVFAQGPFELATGIGKGARLRMGEPLLCRIGRHSRGNPEPHDNQ